MTRSKVRMLRKAAFAMWSCDHQLVELGGDGLVADELVEDIGPVLVRPHVLVIAHHGQCEGVDERPRGLVARVRLH